MNVENLKNILPQKVYEELPSIISIFNTPNKLAHFLSQTKHESANFTRVYENLNYSPKRLTEIFPKYFKSLKEATQMCSQPNKQELIANRVYGGRMGNTIDEGFKFRGRGYIQLTGKNNYSLFDKEVDEDIIINPDLVATKYPLKSACWFFTQNKIVDLMIEPDVNNTLEQIVTKITIKINGGTIGLNQRIQEYKEIYELIK